jgi:Zn-dependent protease with chaperone function
MDALKREGWRLKLPDSPVTLDDRRLLEYRHPTESWMLALATAVIALVGVSLLIRESDVLIGVAIVYFSMMITSMQAKTFYRLQGAEVTSTQFPAIFEIAEKLRQRFGAPPTRIFVLRKQSFKAEAFGFKAPYVIVLPAVLIDSLELEELRYVLGQAFGHICFGHTRVALLMGGEESALPAVLSWFAWIRDLIFAGYWRAATTSGDRAGILACQSVVKAVRAQVKLSVGSKQIDEVRIEDFVEQAFKLSQSFARVQAALIRWRTPIPPLIPRLESMIAWAGFPPLERD